MLPKRTNELAEFLSDYELPEDFMEELDRLQEELDSRRARLEEAEKALAAREKDLETQQRKMEARQARLDVIEEKLKERFTKLKDEEKRLEVENRSLESRERWVKTETASLQAERDRIEGIGAGAASTDSSPFRAEAPGRAIPKAETPKQEIPKADAPKVEPLKKDVPKPDAPQKDVPKPDVPRKEIPKALPPKAEPPKKEPPRREPPKQTIPERKLPKAEPVKSASVDSEVPWKSKPAPAGSPRPRPEGQPRRVAAAGGAAAAAGARSAAKQPHRAGGPNHPNQTKKPAKKRKKKKNRLWLILIPIVVLLLAILLGFFLGGMDWLPGVEKARTTIQEEIEEAKLPDFEPAATENTKPENLIQDTAIMVGDEIVSSYQADAPIDFGYGQDYTNVEGIVTFRGNNFRESSFYGVADIRNQKFGSFWEVGTGALKAPDGEVWTGSGWVGQPLMMTWPKEVRQHMNMYDWAKEEETLTEVIYATMDGNIYFLDLRNGEKTRDPMYLGYTFKGAGALDPRGYPIMYLGSGYDSTQGKSRVFIINLLDCEVMYTFGNGDSFSKRGTLSYFDGSALVDAETDKLIYPGENGILYIYQLNTFYDEANGVLTIDPSPPVKWRYYGKRSGYMYLGMEDSAIIWRGHIFFTTNDGYLFCLNLNTLETVWVQDVLDDTNCTSTLELEDGHPYLYVSTSFHLGWRSSTTAEIPVWKIDAENGEIVWKTSYECRSTKGNSGGVQGSIALGKNSLSDLIFVPVARTPSVGAGFLVALNKQTGEEVWKLSSPNYSWSSPVAVYDKDGKGYVCFCNSAGKLVLLDGLTGEVLDSMELGSNVEASPAVFNNKLVVGTRGCKIYGIDLE